MNQSIKTVLLVDDHPLIMAGIKSILNLGGRFKVVGEAKNGVEGFEKFKELMPDIAILDIDMPQMNGIELANKILSLEAQTKIVFLTSHTDINTFSQATKINYHGFLFKENALDEIVACLEKVINNQIFLSDEFKRFIESNNRVIQKINAFKARFNKLTKSEIKVLKLIASAKTTPEIAAELFNSYKTIENHRYNICQKLEITGSNNLLSFALEHKELINEL